MLFAGLCVSLHAQLTCVADAGVPLAVRAEGLTERVGDITLTCTGGTPTPAGVQVPAVNLTVTLNSAITSRLYPNAWSEVLLLIDEPGSGLQGTPTTQLACNNPNGTCSITGTGTGIGTYDGSQGRPNVFQGQVSQNGVTFFSVPVDPPSTGKARVLRMTNMRINATQVGFGYPVTASISTPLNVGNGYATVGSVSPSMNFGVRTPNNSSASEGFAVTPCATSGTQRAGVLRFAEVYGGAFARRNAASFVDNNTSPPPVPQNIPGANYGTESGFYAPGLTAPTGDFATIGLANAGTKLRAVLNNIPAGARIYVSANRVTFTNGNPVVATSGLVARLTQNENAPFAAATPTTTLDGIPAVELPVANGSATAVWEVLFKDPEAGSENADFPVWVLPAGTASGSATVNGSYAPAPPNFTGGEAASTTLPLPRFVSDSLAGRSLFSLAACSVIPTPLGIVTTALPTGNTVSNYSATLTGRGGTLPYTWSVSGLPASLFLNPATGVISGLVQVAGTYSIAVTLQDASRATVNAVFPLVIASPPPPQITPTANLPVGTVGVPYSGTLGATGGNGQFSFSLAGGSLPDGLTLSQAGTVTGTPTIPGQFSFTVAVADSAGGAGSSAFTILIQPAPLGITGGPTKPVTVGSPVSITFGGTGGVPPYRFTPGGLPSGLSFANATLSGTPDAVGDFNFNITIADSKGNVATRGFTLTVTSQTPTLSLGGTLLPGKVGVEYTAQLSVTGGTPPYTFSGTGLPDGLTLSTSGVVSGIPKVPGTSTFNVSATDSKNLSGTGNFAITIAPADLIIVTPSLPDGVVGTSYSATLAAAGGIPPYTWTVTGLPDGVTANGATIGGSPTTAGKFTVTVSVKDSQPGSAPQTKSYGVTVAPIPPPPLLITTVSLSNGVVGTPYNANITASGGATPYTFSATGLPTGVSISASGVITGTPIVPGDATIVVTLKDSGGASTSKNFAVTMTLPATPPLNFGGITASANPQQQLRLQVTLGNAFPLDVIVTLTLSFAPDSGADDPTIQFSTGGRTARITVPAGSTTGSTDVGLQTGTVAGLITVTAQMQTNGQDVTPSPAPRTTTRIAAGAPVIVPGTLTAVRNATGFTITLTGYVTDREMTQANFQFTAATGSNLQTTTLSVPIDAMFAQYFSSAGATPTGSQFTFTQSFTVTGSPQAVVSVTVTLVNRIGQSAPATATVN